MTELKKCPFCGGTASEKVIRGFDNNIFSVYIICNNCSARTLVYSTEESARNAWNLRVK